MDDSLGGRVLVAGASGFVGRALLPRLLDLGYAVVATTRRGDAAELSQVPAYRRSACTWQRWDFRKSPIAERLFKGVSTAYYLLHGVGESKDYALQDEQMARRFAVAAKRAQVQRLIYLGGVSPATGASPHLLSRRSVGEILRQHGPPTLELRASLIIGQESAAFQILRDVALRLPVLLLPSFVDAVLYPIAIDDVCMALTTALELQYTESLSLDLPGPQRTTLRELLGLIHELRASCVPQISAPWLTPDLISKLLPLVTRIAPPLQRELLLSAACDLANRDPAAGDPLILGQSIWPLLGLRPQIPLAAGILRALTTERVSKTARGVAAFLAEASVHAVGRALYSGRAVKSSRR